MFSTTTTFRVVKHDDLSVLGVARTSMITAGGRSQLLLLSCVEHDDSTVLGVARTSTITSGVCSLLLLLLSVLSDTIT